MNTEIAFPSMFVSVVLGLVFFVMGVVFVAIPYNLGSHRVNRRVAPSYTRSEGRQASHAPG